MSSELFNLLGDAFRDVFAAIPKPQAPEAVLVDALRNAPAVYQTECCAEADGVPCGECEP
jgi:hypothetical protein